MRLIIYIALIFGLSNNLIAQCSLSSFPNDKSMYDVNICLVQAPVAFVPIEVQLDKPSVIHKRVDFHFSDDFFTSPFISLPFTVDFGNEQGDVLISSNTVQTVTYTDPGLKKVKICNASGDNCSNLFELTVKEPGETYQAPDSIFYLNGGRGYLSLGDGNTKITKPIIFVEGLDLGTQVLRDPDFDNEIIRWGDRGWDVFTMGMEERVISGLEVLQNAPDQITDFTNEGYDFILLDFAEGAGDIQANAEVLKELINDVNGVKVADANGVEHENIVIGASMGAIVARIALAQMEDDGENHCTSTYVSFDGPHKGANISLGLQSLVWHSATFIDENASDYDASVRKKTWESLLLPAPQQLVIHNLLGAYQEGLIDVVTGILGDGPKSFEDFEDLSIDYTAARQSLISLLDEVGYPEQTRNIAVVNGNGDGQNIGIPGGANLLHADAWEGSFAGMVFRSYIHAVNGATMNVTDAGFNSFSQLVTRTHNSEKSIFYGKTPVNFNFLGIPSRYAATAVEMLTDIPLHDSAPGSLREDIRNLIIPILDDLPVIGDNNDGDGPGDDGVVNFHHDQFSFVSTISALDMNTENLFFNVSNLTEDDLDSELVPFSSIYVPSAPELHGHTNNGNRTWINAQIAQSVPDLAINGVLPNENGTTYNYGYIRNKVPNLVINNGGFLRINNDGPTAYLDEEDSNKEIFKAFTSSCGGSNITVNNGGQFIIGKNFNPVKKGYMHFTNGSTLTLNAGSQTFVEQHSHLIFQNGSEGNIESGALLAARFGAQIYVKAGATLHVKAGGKLRIMHFSDLIVEDGGKLIIDDGAIIQLWDNNGTDGRANIQIKGELVVNGDFAFSGTGYFTFFETHDLTFGPEAVGFILEGAGKGTRFIELQSADFNVEDHMLRLSNGKVDYLGSSRLRVMNGGDVVLNGVELRALESSGSGSPTGLVTEDVNKLDVFDCDFKDLSVGIFSLANQNTGGLYKLGNSIFTNSSQGLSIYGMDKFSIINTQFIAGANSLNAIWAYDVGDVHSWGDAISGYSSNGFTDERGAILLENVYSFRMEHGNVFDNEVGILSPMGSKTNIFLSKGTKVENNGIGINMVKGGIDSQGLDYGLVHVDCAKFINNSVVGIKGEDVLLEIDAFENCLGCFPFQIRHNVFLGEYLFEICYVDRDVNQVSARGNYWGGGSNAPVPDQYRFRNNLVGCLGMSNIIFDAQDPELNEPLGNCAGGQLAEEFVGPVDKMCIIKIESTSHLVHQQFLEAYEDFRVEEFDNSSSKYAPIAAIPDNIRMQSSNVCQRYIDVARVMTHITNSSLSEPSNPTGGIKSDSDDYTHLWSTKAIAPSNSTEVKLDFKVYPNPASELVTMELNQGKHQIRFLNALGKLQHTVTGSDQILIDIKEWPKGLYLIEVLNLETNLKQTSKIIIQ